MARHKQERKERLADLAIEPGFHVFLGDGAEAFGAIRGLHGQALIVYIENGGDFELPLDAVEKVSNQKVLVRWDGLTPAMQNAVKHALDLEDYPPAEEDPEARRMDAQDEQDARPEAFGPVVR